MLLDRWRVLELIARRNGLQDEMRIFTLSCDGREKKRSSPCPMDHGPNRVGELLPQICVVADGHSGADLSEKMCKIAHFLLLKVTGVYITGQFERQ